MNILLTNSTDLFAGGEDYVLLLARHLAGRGHTVTVSANPGHLLLAKCAAAGLATLPLRYEGMGRVFAVAAALRKAVLERDIAVVHSNANYDRTVSAMAAGGVRRAHVASIHSAHSIQHNITHWLRNRWGIDHFIADADAVKEVLVTTDRIPAGKITVVGNVTRPGAFPVRDMRDQTVMKRYRASGGKGKVSSDSSDHTMVSAA